MTIRIPEKFMGKPIAGSMEIVLAQAPPPLPPQGAGGQNLGIGSINPREYIQVGLEGLGGAPVVISSYELQDSNNKNYENAHRFVLEKGLYMPTPRIFMRHFMNVLEAKKGNRALNYSDGAKVPDAEVEEMYKHLTTNHKAIFGSQPGVWTWLNAGFNGGNLETVTGLNSDNSLKIVQVPLENCLGEDVYVNLDSNSQGLASSTSKCSNQAYSQGQNIKFWFPRDKAVARFIAIAGRAILSCGRDATNANPALGVFACAEGAVAKK